MRVPPSTEQRRAVEADRPAIEGLLAASSLPVAGLDDALPGAVVVTSGDRLVGCAAVEVRGSSGLLRSVAVEPGHRRAGLGRALVVAAEELAAGAGVRDLYLLTETAATWFPRLGYEPVDREAIPVAVQASAEFRGACPVTAVAMRKRLG